MTQKGKLVLITALMLVCGSPAAIAQSYGATGPARADTTDPNSAPTRNMRQSAITSESRIYARGQPTARPAARRAGAAQAAAQPDGALQAQRNTAMLMGHAMAPWTAGTPAPGAPARRARR